jgi:hypothetical protein
MGTRTFLLHSPWGKKGGGEMVSGLLEEAVFGSFLQWLMSWPNAEGLLTQLKLVEDALSGEVVDRRAAREAARCLGEVAQDGPFSEVIVCVFDMLAEAFTLA